MTERAYSPADASAFGTVEASGTELALAASSTRLLTADDLAARWQVPQGHVYRLAREGKLPVVRLGRYRRFRLAEIEGFEMAGGVAADE